MTFLFVFWNCVNISWINIIVLYLIFSCSEIILAICYLHLFVKGPMSYLRYLCLFVSNTDCVVFFFVLFTLCCQFLWIVHFWLLLRYSLTFILNLNIFVNFIYQYYTYFASCPQQTHRSFSSVSFKSSGRGVHCARGTCMLTQL